MKKFSGFLFAAFTSCASACAKPDRTASSHPEVSAAVAEARLEPFVESVGAIGIVSARPGGTARLSSPVQARIASVTVVPGQTVGRGTVLITLDQTAFVAATRSTQAALAAAQTVHDRTKRLVAEGILPRKDLDQSTADLARTRAEASTAARARQLSVLRSPISGIVTSVNAALGGTADPSQALVEITDPSLVDIVFSVTPEQAARIRTGDKVALSGGQAAGSERLGVAIVMDVAGAVDTLTHAVAVRAHAPATRSPLRIAQTVFGRIEVAMRQHATVVPAMALVPDGEGFKVFVVDRNMIAHSRSVTVGAKSDSTAEILKGLIPGERIVTAGAYGIGDSTRIILSSDSTSGGS